MKALLSEKINEKFKLSLKRIDMPSIEDDEVLIKVAACGVNYPDTLIIKDQYQIKPTRPFAPGGEVSGTIVNKGSKVKEWKENDRVIAITTFGGMAEYVSCKTNKLVKIPDKIPLVNGAGFLFTYGTAYHALHDRGRLGHKETVLVLGAAGGVGLAAVELAKEHGAIVFGAVSDEQKKTAVLEAGADHCFLYPKDIAELPAKLRSGVFKDNLTNNKPDIIFDIIGGAYSEAALRTIAWEGRFLIVGFPNGIAKLPLNLPLLKGCECSGVFWGTFLEKNPIKAKKNHDHLVKLLEKGILKPRIEKVFGLENAENTIERLARREAIGKLIIVISDD
ncbi:MAG: NADPH:quinone oxidoreductase family protein [Pseudomonadota bacterium]|nr:NADPH:quinone oxidoreductase family protein [Pseudomonadota bacterium]